MLPKKGDYAQERHKAACVAHPFKPSSVARTLQHGATAPRYNVHHNAYYTLLPFLYRIRIFSFPSPNTVSVTGGCSCCGGSDCDSAQHRMRHTRTLAHSHAVTLRWMGAGPCRFMPGASFRKLEAGQSTLSASSHNVASIDLLASPTSRRSGVKALRQVAGP